MFIQRDFYHRLKRQRNIFMPADKFNFPVMDISQNKHNVPCQLLAELTAHCWPDIASLE
jgi:hypothetical protein